MYRSSYIGEDAAYQKLRSRLVFILSMRYILALRGIGLKIRYISVICLVLVSLLMAGCSGDMAPSGPIATTTPPAAQPTNAPVITPSSIRLSGSGDHASQKFHLDSGLAIFNMTHQGTYNYAVWIDHNGLREDMLVSVIGPFDGSAATCIFVPGDYALDIKADGPWSVDITQPVYTTADKAPINLSDKGQRVSRPFYLDAGPATFKMKHDGSSDFIINLLDSNGERHNKLVDWTGPFEWTETVDVEPGIYLLNVDADGNWQVQVGQ